MNDHIDFNLDPRSESELERQRVREVERVGRVNEPEPEQQENDDEIRTD